MKECQVQLLPCQAQTVLNGACRTSLFFFCSCSCLSLHCTEREIFVMGVVCATMRRLSLTDWELCPQCERIACFYVLVFVSGYLRVFFVFFFVVFSVAKIRTV